MDASTSTESPDTHMDFNIPVERSDDDWDLDNPFHAVELVRVLSISPPHFLTCVSSKFMVNNVVDTNAHLLGLPRQEASPTPPPPPDYLLQ